jgi:hypothetical protein
MSAGSARSSRKSRASENSHGVSVQQLEAACEIIWDLIDCSIEARGSSCPVDHNESASSIVAQSIHPTTSSM